MKSIIFSAAFYLFAAQNQNADHALSTINGGRGLLLDSPGPYAFTAARGPGEAEMEAICSDCDHGKEATFRVSVRGDGLGNAWSHFEWLDSAGHLMPELFACDHTHCVGPGLPSGGAVGQAGPQGIPGPPGPPGPAGFLPIYRGAWDAAAKYVANDLVLSGGQYFTAVKPNSNVTPGADASAWGTIAILKPQ